LEVKLIEFEGEEYFDDRLFVYLLCRGRIKDGPHESVETTVFYEPEAGATDLAWCLVTYWNRPGYPAYGVDYFESKDDAADYLSLHEPLTPLISLDGRVPIPPLAYADYLEWKRKNNLAEVDYKELFTHLGTNPMESWLYTREQFLKNKKRLRAILDDARRERSHRP
jgi:hypothetical protein